MTKEPVVDLSLGDVWRTRLFQQSGRRGSADDVSGEGGRTAPSEYYSRHHLLRPESPPSYVMPRGRKVFSFRPGTVQQQDPQKGWPARAHDGSTGQQRFNEDARRN